jgi:hypothetical protein
MKAVPLIVGLALCGCGAKSPETELSVPSEPSPASVSDLRAAYDTAKREYAAAKSDTTKLALSKIATDYGIAVMEGSGSPKEKYPKALSLYREALALDPSNSRAKKNEQMIIDIYEQLGRKPPTG